MSKSPIAVIAVLVVSLVIWTVFYYLGFGLGREDTLVVVGIVALVVFGLWWAVSTLRGRVGK